MTALHSDRITPDTKPDDILAGTIADLRETAQHYHRWCPEHDWIIQDCRDQPHQWVRDPDGVIHPPDDQCDRRHEPWKP